MSSWYDFHSRCPGKNCTNTNEIFWRHSTCLKTQLINQEGFVKCRNNCFNPAFILEFSFKCGNHNNFRKCSGEKALSAILVALKVQTLDKKVRKKIIDKILNYEEDDYEEEEDFEYHSDYKDDYSEDENESKSESESESESNSESHSNSESDSYNNAINADKDDEYDYNSDNSDYL